MIKSKSVASFKHTITTIYPQVDTPISLTQQTMGGNSLPGISQLPDEWKPNSNGYPPLSTTTIPVELTGILPDITGSGKSEMVAYKLVVSIYRLVDKVKGLTQMSGNPKKEVVIF